MVSSSMELHHRLLCALSCLKLAFILPLQMREVLWHRRDPLASLRGGRAGAWLEGHPVTATELSFQP